MNAKTNIAQARTIAVQQPQDTNVDVSALMVLVQRAALDPQFDVGKLQALMEMKERWDANEARKAYNVAFAAFKDEAVRIIKSRTVEAGPLKGTKYAELYAVVNAVTPALSKFGLSAAWKLSKDEKDWIEVTCTVRHVAGHSESVSMGGPPDTGGAKTAVQARASTVSYLERYTLKAITGLSEQADDTDGACAQGLDHKVADWIAVFDAIDKPQTEADANGRKAELLLAYGGMPETVPPAIIAAYRKAIKRLRVEVTQ